MSAYDGVKKLFNIETKPRVPRLSDTDRLATLLEVVEEMAKEQDKLRLRLMELEHRVTNVSIASATSNDIEIIQRSLSDLHDAVEAMSYKTSGSSELRDLLKF